MRSSRLLWGMTSLTALVTTVLLLFGFIYAVDDMLRPSSAPYNQAEPAPEQADDSFAALNEIKVAAIGDSLTKGTGDATGQGYVRHTIRLLGERVDKPVRLLNNLGINGLRTDQLEQKLEESGVRYVLQQAELILLTIGGNDLFQMAANRLDLTSRDIDPRVLHEHLPEHAARLESVLTKLNDINPQAKIIYVGLYNPFYDLDETREANLLVQEWNDRAFQVTNRYPNMTLVPTLDLFQSTIIRYLSSDHFHPNEEGYVRIAERIVQAIE